MKALDRYWETTSKDPRTGLFQWHDQLESGTATSTSGLPISHAVLSSMLPHARRVMCHTWCPSFSATNWCLQSDLMTDSPSGLPPVMTHPCMHPSGCDNLITSECPSILGTGPPANEPCWVRGHPVCTSHAPLTWPLIRRSLRSDHHLAHRCLARAGNQSRIMNIGRCYCPDSV